MTWAKDTVKKNPELLSKRISLRKAFTSHLKTSATGKFTTAYDKLFQQLNVSLEICLVSLTDVEPYLLLD